MHYVSISISEYARFHRYLAIPADMFYLVFTNSIPKPVSSSLAPISNTEGLDCRYPMVA